MRLFRRQRHLSRPRFHPRGSATARELRGVPLTKKERRTFLRALKGGLTVTAAAKATGRERRSFQRLRKRDEAFAAAWDRAVGNDAYALEWDDDEPAEWSDEELAEITETYVRLQAERYAAAPVPAPEPEPAPTYEAAAAEREELERWRREREEAEAAEAERQRRVREDFEYRIRNQEAISRGELPVNLYGSDEAEAA
jgi:hypothetical protein